MGLGTRVISGAIYCSIHRASRSYRSDLRAATPCLRGFQYFRFAAYPLHFCRISCRANSRASAPPIIDLPSSKQLIGEAPGHPQRVNGLPISMAISPDGRYVVTVNAGYGTFESQYNQSLAVLDTQTGALADFPDPRTAPRQQADALLRPGFQPRWQPHLRQHGFDDRS